MRVFLTVHACVRTHTGVHVSVLPEVDLNVLHLLREEEEESSSMQPQPPSEASWVQRTLGPGGEVVGRTWDSAAGRAGPRCNRGAGYATACWMGSASAALDT